MPKEKCGDYGGRNQDGQPCGAWAGAGVEGEDEGRCADHRGDAKTQNISPVDLIERIRKYERNPDDALAVDPNDVTTKARRLCVPHLQAEGMTQAEIASVFEVNVSTINRDIKRIRNNEIDDVLKVSENDLAYELIKEARRAAPKLRAQGEFKKAFEVKDKLKDALDDLNLIELAPDRVVLSLDELDAFVGLAVDTIREKYDDVESAEDLIDELDRRISAGQKRIG